MQQQQQHQLHSQPHMVNAEYMAVYPPPPHTGGMPYPMYDAYPPSLPLGTMPGMEGMVPPQQPQSPYNFTPPSMYNPMPIYSSQPIGINLPVPGMAQHPNGPPMVMMAPQPYGILPAAVGVSGAPPSPYQSPVAGMATPPSHRYC